MARGASPDFEHEEFTPITTIAVVRQELKEDIKEMRDTMKIRLDQMVAGDATLRNEVGQLFGAIKTTNEQFPKMIDQFMNLVAGEFTTHQRDTSFSMRAKWLNISKIVAFVFSVAGATLLLNAVTRGC